MPPSRPHGLSRRRLLAGSAALLAAGCAPDQVALPIAQPDLRPGGAGPVALTGLRLPGSGEPVAIAIEGDRITAVGPAAPDGVAVQDLDGGWVVPGFIDCHVHLQFAEPAAITRGGVTTVRDLGGPPSAAQAVRERLVVTGSAGEGAAAPRILLAGRILTAVGGYPSRSWGADGTAREVTGPGDAAAAVAEQVAAGADVIKLALEAGPVLDLATTQAIVDAARAAGLRTTAHVGSAAWLEQALAAGVDELAHLPLHDVTPAEMAAVAEAGVALCPTLAIRGPDAGAARAVAAFREAGGLVLYGSDLGNGGTSPGIMVEEVRALLAAGMPPEAVLRSATADAAAHVGIEAGALEPGLLADLVVLGADPFADPAAYDDVRLVVSAGRAVPA